MESYLIDTSGIDVWMSGQAGDLSASQRSSMQTPSSRSGVRITNPIKLLDDIFTFNGFMRCLRFWVASQVETVKDAAPDLVYPVHII
jgi:hypothetical protein